MRSRYLIHSKWDDINYTLIHYPEFDGSIDNYLGSHSYKVVKQILDDDGNVVSEELIKNT